MDGSKPHLPCIDAQDQNSTSAYIKTPHAQKYHLKFPSAPFESTQLTIHGGELDAYSESDVGPNVLVCT